MSTKRTPIHRPPRGDKFAPAALEAFRKIQKLFDECACEERDWKGKYWDWEPCAACQERSRLGAVIARELDLPVWRWHPCVQHPDAVSPYPAGSAADKNWQPNLEAQALYRALEEAAARVTVT
jgi:hypothetical protein